MASKRKRRRERPPPQYSDPTPERLRHAAGAVDDSWRRSWSPTLRLLTMRDSALERLYDRGRLSQRQYYTAQEFRWCWTRCRGSGYLASIDAMGGFCRNSTGRHFGGFN